MKLLVLHVDTVAIWDVKEGEIINELRSPKDLVSKPIDIEWAASDRPVIATSDGCLRIMSLALSLAASTGPLDVNEVNSCVALLPNKVQENIKLMLHHQPWNEKFSLIPSQGLSVLESNLVKSFIDLMDPNHQAFLSSDNLSSLERCRFASQLCNASQFEIDFWTIATAMLYPTAASTSSTLDTRYDLTSDCASYLRYQLERLHLHESKIAGNGNQDGGQLRRRVIDQMLCLGLKDEAVALLLESEPKTNPKHYEDNLRACLVSACDGKSNQNNTTMKLVCSWLDNQ